MDRVPWSQESRQERQFREITARKGEEYQGGGCSGHLENGDLTLSEGEECVS